MTQITTDQEISLTPNNNKLYVDNIHPTVDEGEYKMTPTPGHQLNIVYTVLFEKYRYWEFPSTK